METLCDHCDGAGIEDDAGEWPIECHLCEGAGVFGDDGFPLADEDDEQPTE